jgi:hypothetical protein
MDAPDPTPEGRRANVLRLVFGGEEDRLNEFIRVPREDIPPGTGVVVRGSAVTGQRWKDGAPFDADGPGTSDLDVTLVGDKVIGLFTVRRRSRASSKRWRAIPDSRTGGRAAATRSGICRAPLDHVQWRKPQVSRHAFIEIVPAGGAWRIVGVHLSAAPAAWTERRRIGYTFPTWDPHVRLDYLFVPKPCVERVSRCQVFSANDVREASDHFPLIAELR